MNTSSPKIANRLLRQTSSIIKTGAVVKIGPQAAHSEASIQVNRSERGVESIEVICSCGERIVIRCDYE